MPEYVAVMRRAPGETPVVTQSEIPPDNATDSHPTITFAPSRNTTVPVGVPDAPLTAAVKVTD